MTVTVVDVAVCRGSSPGECGVLGSGGIGRVFRVQNRCGRATCLPGTAGIAVAGDDDSGKVDGVGCGDGDGGGAVAGAGGAEGVDGLGKGELFAAEAGDEAAAADLAAGFEPAEDAEEVAPFGGVGLAGRGGRGRGYRSG